MLNITLKKYYSSIFALLFLFSCSNTKITDIKTNSDNKSDKSSIKKENGKIYFYSDRENNKYQIFEMNEDGSNVKNLSKNNFISYLHQISPDNKKIAFIANIDNNNEIYIMDIDGSNQINLSNNSARDVYPVFSPDSKKIAFISNRDGNDGIYTINIDGSDLKKITKNNLGHSYPYWSEDSKKLIFQEKIGSIGQIFLADSNGEKSENLGKNSFDKSVSIYLNKDTEILFLSERNKKTNLYITNDNFLTDKKLSDGNEDVYPVLSPDNSKIVFVSKVINENLTEEGAIKAQINIINKDGSNLKTLSEDYENNTPSWSPDGKKIAYSTFRDGNNEIYITSIDSPKDINLTKNKYSDFYPKWLN